MRLAQPEWLWGLVALAGLALWLRRADRRRAADLALLADAERLTALARGLDPVERQRRRRLRLAALALALLALARPQWGQEQETVERSGRQVMLVLDVSASMRAADLAPDRLDRARLEIQALLERIPGDQAGLVLFSGAAFNQVPLTVDHGLLLGMLEQARPELISRPGTNLGSALDTAAAGFDEARLADRAIVLFSDGEDPEPGAVEAAERAAEAGIVVHAVGLGSEQGARVPETDAAGRQLQRRGADGAVAPAWIVDDSGQEVVSRLDERVLRAVAGATGGRYVRAAGLGAAATEVARALEGLERGALGGELGAQPIERFQWPAALALALLLLAESPLRGRGSIVLRLRGRASTGQAAGSARSLVLLLGLGLGGLAIAGCGATPAALNAAGNQAYSEEDWAAAETLYRQALEADPDRAALLYNLATSRYRQAEVDEARQLLRRALEQGDSPEAPELWYALGTMALNAGELEVAVSALKAVLRARPDDEAARHNLELALAALTATPPASPSGEPEGEGSPPPDAGSPTPGGTPEPQAGSATPDGEGEGARPDSDGEGGTPEPDSGQPEPGEEGSENEDQSDAASEEPESLSPEQAEQLLESLGRDVQSLQERLGQIYVVPGPPPAQRW